MGVSNTLRPIDLLGITATLLLALIIFNVKGQVKLIEGNSSDIKRMIERTDNLNIEYRLIQQDLVFLKTQLKDLDSYADDDEKDVLQLRRDCDYLLLELKEIQEDNKTKRRKP